MSRTDLSVHFENSGVNAKRPTVIEWHARVAARAGGENYVEMRLVLGDTQVSTYVENPSNALELARALESLARNLRAFAADPSKGGE
jgi:hypothetical protein